MTQQAMFGAGCFWGVEEAFRQLDGVTKTEVGYAGGHIEDPTYEAVCAKTTGHAEVVRLEFDPATITYEKLLETFWKIHDPTQINRQGPDVGDQYRTVIYTYDDAQTKVAEASKENEDNSGIHAQPIATQIEPAPVFYRAEEYHQQYFAKRGLRGCHI